MEFSKEHQRHAILFLFQKNISNAAEIRRQISPIFGETTLSERAIRDWLQKFSVGNFSLQDEARSGRPSEINNDELFAAVRENPRSTTRELAMLLNCTQPSIVGHLSNLGFVKRLGSWIPHRLSENQREHRISTCVSLLSRERTYNWLRNVITGDEKWVLYLNEERKGQWVLRGESPEPEPKPDIHQKKILLSIFWDYKGIIYFELLKPNTTINADTYCYQLDRLYNAHASLRPERDNIILLHDNARPHVAHKTIEKIINEFHWQILPHPPYSPDLAPSDFFLFRHLSYFLHEKNFSNFDELNFHIRSFFDSKSEDFYTKAIMELPDRWTYVVDSNGEYCI